MVLLILTKCAVCTNQRKETRIMKKATRILAFVLAILMLSAVLVACNSSKDGATETTTSSTNPGGTTNPDGDGEVLAPPPIEQTNYETTFNFLVLNDIFRFEYFYASEQVNEVMNDAIFTRQEEVLNHIGVEITAKKHEVYTEYKTDFANSIKAGDGLYQSCLTHVNVDVAPMVTECLLYDFNEFEAVDLEREYWNKSLMDSLSYNGANYLAYGDFCLSNTYVIAFDKVLLDKYCLETLGDDTIYDVVEDKKWTLDKMMELASKSWDDKNGDGKKDVDDVYGISGYFWVPACSFLHSSGLNITKYNSSTKKYDMSISANAKKTEQLVSKLKELYNAEYSFFWGPWDAAASDPSKQVDLKGKNTLFSLTGTYKLIELVASEAEFGVLPYPTWEEGKEYRSLSWNGYMVAPYNVDSTYGADIAGETFELLGWYSAPVTTAFYEKLLGAQVSESRDDAKMLDIIWDSQVSDFGMAYSSYGTKSMDALLYAIPRIVLGVDSVESFSKYWAKHGSNASKDLNKVQTPTTKK